MIQKHVQFETAPRIIIYCQDDEEAHHAPPLPKSSPMPSHQTPPPSSTPSLLTKKTSSSNTNISSNRPFIPPLDLSQLCHTAIFKYNPSDTNATPTLLRPISPPALSIDTLHHTPLYYTAQSTCYF